MPSQMGAIVALILLGYLVSINIASYTHYRLPTALQPERYKLKIITHLKEPNNFTFEGDVSIHFKVLHSTSNITLHARNLTIDDTKIKLRSSSNATYQNCIKGIETVPEYDYYIIKLCEPLQKYDMYTVKLHFSSKLSNNFQGYFLTSYTTKESNETRWLSVTQFESVSARTAFPCLDEPNYKAKFKIWLGHNKSLTALSNMPLEEQIPIVNSDNYIWSIFEESIPMSTYLVAFSINDYVYKSSPQLKDTNVTFRTWFHRESIDHCEYASEVGPKLLKFFEDTFGITFPLKKLDSLSVPGFSGGMENWGLITYADSDILFSHSTSANILKEDILKLVAHELAHQWFGNLVTMKWWSDLWLNEGFATYVSTLGAENLYPEWNSYNEDNFLRLLSVLHVDVSESSHPISQPVRTSNDIDNVFDAISYGKGAAVLRMLHTFMGNVAFFEAVRYYLELHKYQNAEQDDFWAALTKMSHKYEILKTEYDIKTIMDSWTLQTGYPLVKVKRDYDTGTIYLSQQRYMHSAELSPIEAKKCWWIPLSYTTASEGNFMATQPKAWLECDESGRSVNLTLDYLASGDEWILFNLQYAGIYRVMYDSKNWQLLSHVLNNKEFENIHVLNRAQLIDDALAFAWSGHLDYNVAFDILDYLRQESDYLPWSTALSKIKRLKMLLKPFEEQTKYLKAYILYLIEPIYYELDGLNDTAIVSNYSHTAIMNKNLITHWACDLGLEDCIQTALHYFKQWKSSEDPDIHNIIPVDLRATVYCAAIRYGDSDDWDFIWQRSKESHIISETNLLFQSLSCTRNETNLRRYVKMALDQFWVGDVTSAVTDLGLPMVWDYLVENMDTIRKMLHMNLNFLCYLMEYMAYEIVSPEAQNFYKNFIDTNKEDFLKCPNQVQAALETVEENVNWIEKNAKEMKEILRSRILNMKEDIGE